MAVHGMIDLETLGVEPDSVIITVGAIKFDPYTDVEPHSGLYLRCDIEEQSEELGRTIDDNTMEWWTKQPKNIQDEAFGEHEDRVNMVLISYGAKVHCLIMLYYKIYIRMLKNLVRGTSGKLEIVELCLV
jgi:hypothetical protein